MEDRQTEEQHPGPPWLLDEMPLEMAFECESVVRRIAQLTEEQTRELAAIGLRHNFRLVHMLRLSIDRVTELEEAIDSFCEQVTDPYV